MIPTRLDKAVLETVGYRKYVLVVLSYWNI